MPECPMAGDANGEIQAYVVGTSVNENHIKQIVFWVQIITYKTRQYTVQTTEPDQIIQ